jgi:hypothetical protein
MDIGTLLNAVALAFQEHPYYTAGIIVISAALFFSSGLLIGRKLHKAIDPPGKGKHRP